MGRSLFKWRNVVCLPMIVILPVSLMAHDSEAAMLRSSGGVLLNKNMVPASAAIFPDDLIETPQNAAARIEATGSTADLNPETLVQFEGDELVLEHGSLSVNTSRGLRVRVGCVTLTPVNTAAWTHYDVADRDGKISVSALKDDVYIDARSKNPQQAKKSEFSTRVTVREGEQKSREENCGAAVTRATGRVAGVGAIMNSPYVQWPAVGIIGGLTCWALCRGDDPISPWRP